MKQHLILQLTFISTLIFICCPAAPAQVTFTDVTGATGLGDVQAQYGNWGDYDNDGAVDLVLHHGGRGGLYRNAGDGAFLNVTQTVGIPDIFFRASLGFFLDFDNDGHLDLFFGGGGTSANSALYRNTGDGAFLNVGMELKNQGHNIALSFDADNDGLLDIYVTGQFPSPYSPLLYHNEGGGRFSEIAAQVGLDQPAPDFYGIVLGDYDNDGDLDLFLANRGPGGNEPGTDILYRNDGGTFINVAQEAGVERTANHLDGFFWDYDNDEDVDLFVNGEYVSEADVNTLYRNNGDGTFTDVTQLAGIAPIAKNSFGAWYGDVNNDGWLDLCVTYENTPTFLYHNNGDGTFTEVGRAAGIGVTRTGQVHFVDYDNDGDVDLFIGGSARPALYRNEGTGNRWLQVKLVGAQSNRDAIASRVKVTAGGLSMLREVAGSAGGNSEQSRLPLYFGLGGNPQADVIEIRWPSGVIQTFTNIAANQRLTIHEFEGLLVVIHNAFPAFGDPTGGTPVRIQGEGFIPGSRVTFGGVEARGVRVESPSLIIALTPPGGTGFVDVAVIHPDGRRGILKNGFRYTTLKVIRVTPESGPMTGGVTVQMEGFGFQPGTQALIGGKPLTNVFVTPTLIRGTLPPGTPGVVDVSAINPDGEMDVLRRAFTYISPPMIERIPPPAFVPLAGGGEITIEGSGFIRTPTVQIGGITAIRVEFISADELNVATPLGLALGPQDVVVINPDRQRAVLPGSVEVLSPIKLKSVEPQSGGLAGGTKITIVGEPTVEFSGRNYPSRFVEGAEVFVGGEKVTGFSGVTVQSDHIITAITPPNTPGAKDVKVVNPDSSDDTLENAFTYNPLPQILRVAPNNGRLAGGTKVTIQGGGFLPGTLVRFIDPNTRLFEAASDVRVESDTLITAITPKVPDEPGAVNVLVRNPDRQEAVLEAGFTYNPLPRITEISPTFGPTSGGTKLTIRGSGFLQGAKILIGNRPATTEVKDDATLEAVTPPTPQGVLEVRAVNPDTQEAVVREGFLSVGEVAYNYPNPFRAERGTTFRYVTNEPVREMTVRIFNLAGEPVGVAQRANATEVRWVEPDLRIGLYVYLMEVKLEDGQVKRFKRMLEVY